MVNTRKKFPRGILDQVISKSTCDGESERAPGPGLKLQASSARRQAFKHQATSVKPQAASFKRQATSCKLSDPRTTVHGYRRSIRGARTKGLCYDKCIVRMAYMERNLMWTKPKFFTLRYLNF